jgi:hypothetical protein
VATHRKEVSPHPIGLGIELMQQSLQAKPHRPSIGIHLQTERPIAFQLEIVTVVITIVIIVIVQVVVLPILVMFRQGKTNFPAKGQAIQPLLAESPHQSAAIIDVHSSDIADVSNLQKRGSL